jgi:hypothetical protein
VVFPGGGWLVSAAPCAACRVELVLLGSPDRQCTREIPGRVLSLRYASGLTESANEMHAALVRVRTIARPQFIPVQ